MRYFVWREYCFIAASMEQKYEAVYVCMYVCVRETETEGAVPCSLWLCYGYKMTNLHLE